MALTEPNSIIASGAQRMVTPAAASSSKPLRWRVTYASANNPVNAAYNECLTYISVLSAAAGSVQVDVEFFDHDALSVGMSSFSLAVADSHVVGTNPGGGITGIALWGDSWVSTGFFWRGFALVHATDPRILVGAFLTCKEDSASGGGQYQDMRSTANIPAFPVGATAEYFVAGMPSTWTPPVAVPEVPE